MQREIEQKQQLRWHYLTRHIATPCMDRVLALGPSDVPNKRDWKRLLRIAAWIDTHLQRPGHEYDLPNTHVAYLDSFEGLLSKYLGG